MPSSFSPSLKLLFASQVPAMQAEILRKMLNLFCSVIIIVGFLLFSLAVLYVVSKRIGILKLQRVVVASIKAGMVKGARVRQQAAGDGHDVLQHGIPPTIMANPAQNVLHDEL